MPISFTTTEFPDFRRLGAYIDRQLEEAVRDGLDHGQHRMREIVPRDKGTLADAVMVDGPHEIGRSHIRGEVFVNPFVAPHARDVDEGTGVDGPLRRPVTITRQSRKGNRAGAMMFEKNGEGPKFRRTVKIHPSSKIEHGKDFSGRTYRSMVQWTRIRVTTMTAQIAAHIARR